jgi:hypothetical protein
MGRGLLLWLLGVPIPVIILLWLFFGRWSSRRNERGPPVGRATFSLHWKRQPGLFEATGLDRPRQRQNDHEDHGNGDQYSGQAKPPHWKSVTFRVAVDGFE